MNNIDNKVVEEFGKEWKHFDQSVATEKISQDLTNEFNQYFSEFPWELVSKKSVGIDIGCGSGRWAKFVADRVGKLYCCDPSAEALEIGKANLSNKDNCEFILASVDNIPIQHGSLDFGYSLGVLHHIPDTAKGLISATSYLKKGAPFLVYLYYAFDNRPKWFHALHSVSEMGRKLISIMPFPLKLFVSQVIALGVYFPLARFAWLCEKAGANVEIFPLAAYRKRAFYSMRTDALDRFGTRLEQRFTKKEITEMMENAGLEKISFRNGTPYWCACGIKK
jgi:ubiquinone/menaquinone biosynthesis C-methylase UbiE